MFRFQALVRKARCATSQQWILSCRPSLGSWLKTRGRMASRIGHRLSLMICPQRSMHSKPSPPPEQEGKPARPLSAARPASARRGGLRLEGKPPLGQTMWIQRGTRLICAMEQSRAGLWNSQLLTVTGHDAKTGQVQCLETGAEHSLSHQFVAERTRLGWCFTIAATQARTLEGSVAIHDTRHPRFSRRHLTTCLSRARSAAQVSIED